MKEEVKITDELATINLLQEVINNENNERAEKDANYKKFRESISSAINTLNNAGIKTMMFCEFEGNFHQYNNWGELVKNDKKDINFAIRSSKRWRSLAMTIAHLFKDLTAPKENILFGCKAMYYFCCRTDKDIEESAKQRHNYEE